MVVYLSHWLLRSRFCSRVAQGTHTVDTPLPCLSHTLSLPFLRMHLRARCLHFSPTLFPQPREHFLVSETRMPGFEVLPNLCHRPSPWLAFKYQKPGIQLLPYLCSAVSSLPRGKKKKAPWSACFLQTRLATGCKQRHRTLKRKKTQREPQSIF